MKNFFRFFILLLLLASAWQFSRTYFSQQEQQVRSDIRSSFEQEFGQMAKNARQRFGLKQLHQSNAQAPHIVLIHGLDDPGKVWMNLAPVLSNAGFNVWEMIYPNDQPINRSASFLYQELGRLYKADVRDIIIVAHSMGGLITREVLTNPQWQCPVACEENEIPSVKQLIMIGTPNHGSELARFRMLAEIREQVERLLAGQADWLDWIFDGAGEAGIDLIPGSEFLTALNQRPHPDKTDYFIIAGVIGEEERDLLKNYLATLKNQQTITDLLDFILDNIGDGLVSLESARLTGIPIEVVPGNHLTIIRNVSRTSTNTPPAIPIIMRKIQAMEDTPIEKK